MLNIWVLMGGPGHEHDVSLVSGTGMVRQLDGKQYRVFPVVIAKNLDWHWRITPLLDGEKANFAVDSFLNNPATMCQNRPAPQFVLQPADMVLLALHGELGEDGQIQAVLDYWQIPYTGSAMAASALAMDKIRAKDVFKANAIPTPDYAVLRAGAMWKQKLHHHITQLGLPLVMKDPLGGSSLGMGIAQSTEEAESLALDLFRFRKVLLLESYVRGDEFSCGVLEEHAPLPPTQLITDDGFFDYEAKYLRKSKEVTPAEIPLELTTLIQELALKCHHALGLSVYSRTDILYSHGKCYVLETNTLPGFTPQSILPQQAAILGISYSALLGKVIQLSMKKYVAPVS
jgi:D-alanine-D-alanine ligase